MTIKHTATAVRTRARSLALAALLGLAASGAMVPSVHALQATGSGGGQKYCYIPGSNLPYLPGESATFSLNGQPAKSHTCQSDGSWTAIVTTGSGYVWQAWNTGTYYAP